MSAVLDNRTEPQAPIDPPRRRGLRADAISRLAWGARHYGAVLVPLLVNCLTLALLVTADDRRDESHTAEAVVVASQIEIGHRQLARLGQTVFASATLAAKVHTRLQLAPGAVSLIPEHITMEPVPNSIVYRVQGRADDPEWAILMANTAADAFVEELNRVGDGVGTFQVQTRAAEPLVRSSPPLSLPVALAVALVAGALLLVALLALFLRWRRPLLTPAEVSDVVDVPVIASQAIPRRLLAGRADTRAMDDMAASPLMAVLARSLPRVTDGAVVLTGDSVSVSVRRALAARINSARLPGQAPLLALVQEDAAVVDLATTPRILVVTMGVPAGAVVQQVADAGSSTVGIVFLRPRPRRLRASSRRTPQRPSAAPPAAHVAWFPAGDGGRDAGFFDGDARFSLRGTGFWAAASVWTLFAPTAWADDASPGVEDGHA